MAEHQIRNQEVARRKPRQARSRYKIELIFEAALRLIEKEGIDKLTTNAVAEMAGVSIGTLYQYFDDKHGLLQAMVEREMERLAEQVRARMDGQPTGQRGDRVRALVGVVLDSYGGHVRAHGALMSYAMSRGRGGQLAPLFADVTRTLASDSLVDAHENTVSMTSAQAFVLVSAIFGVLRSVISAPDLPHPRTEIEDALVRLVLGFIDLPA